MLSVSLLTDLVVVSSVAFTGLFFVVSSERTMVLTVVSSDVFAVSVLLSGDEHDDKRLAESIRERLIEMSFFIVILLKIVLFFCPFSA